MTTTTVKMMRMIPDHHGTSGQARGQFSRACSARWLDGSGVDDAVAGCVCGSDPLGTASDKREEHQ